MKDPRWRSVTVIPNRSQVLDEFLNTIAIDNISNKDKICSYSLSPFNETKLPFCCTLVGWSQDHNNELLNMLNELAQITTLRGEATSSEGFSMETDYGKLSIVGVYPLLDISAINERSNEYKKISFLLNNNKINSILNKLYSFCFKGAMQTDKLGFFISVIADSDRIAQEKLEEFVHKLNG